MILFWISSTDGNWFSNSSGKLQVILYSLIPISLLIKEAISIFVNTAKENDRLVSAIVKNNMGNLVSDEIFQSITKFLNKFIPHFSNPPHFAYHVVLLSGALTHFLTYYARNNSEMSEKEMALILESFLSGKVFRLLRATNM